MSPPIARLHAPRCVLPSRVVAARKPTAAVRTKAPSGAPHLNSRLARLALAPVARRQVCVAATATDTPASVVAPLQWREVWWPVAFVQDLDASVPCPFTLLGEQIVLWREHGEWRAYVDKCPHRLAPLTEGRINEDGRLECAYHGWAFAGPSGACESVPQDREGGSVKSSPRACVTSYPVAVKQGIVFVFPTPSGVGQKPDKELPAVPIVPELDDPDFVVIDIARGAFAARHRGACSRSRVLYPFTCA